MPVNKIVIASGDKFKTDCIHLLEPSAYDKIYTDCPDGYIWCRARYRHMDMCPKKCKHYDYTLEVED